MKIIQLILKESLHRKFNFLAAVLAIITAVSLYVAFSTTGAAAKRDTRRVLVEMGFNLRLVHRENDLADMYINGYPSRLMPEEFYHKLRLAEGLSYNHIVAVLQRKMNINGASAMIYGLTTSVSPPDKTKKPIIKDEIESGSVTLGKVIANKLGVKRKDTVKIGDDEFIVATVLTQKGDIDDIKIFMNLKDAQKLLDAEQQISEMLAIECLSANCLGLDYQDDLLETLRKDLLSILPDIEVLRNEDLAEARLSERAKSEQFFTLIMSIVIFSCALWIAILAWINVRERKQEIGILRSLGYGSMTISSLFLGKAILIGLIGALLGWLLGSAVSVHYGTQIFKLTANKINYLPELLWLSIFIAPLFAAVSSFISTMLAVVQDPATTLREN